jgi:putative effector of murein hydrolase LrgA (UPF0299 family)
MKIFGHCVVWFLAFCAVLVSPVILIFGVPLAVGIGTELVEAGAGPILAVLMTSTVVTLLVRRQPVRTFAKTMLRSATSGRDTKRLIAGTAARQAAKSIS